jgi:hypothetical protein
MICLRKVPPVCRVKDQKSTLTIPRLDEWDESQFRSRAQPNTRFVFVLPLDSGAPIYRKISTEVRDLS